MYPQASTQSVRPDAPYADRVEDNGNVLIYEGHDVPKTVGIVDPKTHDQPMANPTGSLTENGKFYEAAQRFKNGGQRAELVKVYEKIKPGMWVFN